MENEQAEEKTITEAGSITETTCCIVGGGPGGVMLALLLARKGVPTILLEAAKDFERDFRGETIHPHILEIMDQLGLADELLTRLHTKLPGLQFQFEQEEVMIAHIDRFPIKYPYIAMIPQEDFLPFLLEEATSYPHFQLVMRANVREIIMKEGVVRGVRYYKDDQWHEVHAHLIVGADGRSSRIRTQAGLTLVPTVPPLHLLWFRLKKKPEEFHEITSLAHFARGSYDVVHNRENHWQVAHFIPLSTYAEVRAAGLESLRQEVIKYAPEVKDYVDQIQDWKQVTHLSVQTSYVKRWYLPGLLLIGDAAHIMSPLGGFGINLAIQDAVVTANELTRPLLAGRVGISDLARVQRKRMLPVRLFQVYQAYIQRIAIAPLFYPGPRQLMIRRLLRLPIQRLIVSRLIAYGIGTVRVK